MLIQQQQNGNKGSFFIKNDEHILAEMTYSLSDPNIMIIVHTEVDDSLRGKNVGYQLINHAAEFAREKNLKIIPLCPFARAVFEKKKDEFNDILKK